MLRARCLPEQVARLHRSPHLEVARLQRLTSHASRPYRLLKELGSIVLACLRRLSLARLRIADRGTYHAVLI